MAQQNIDFGSFPDDPDADAIRTAFAKVQHNFTEVYSGIEGTAVASIIEGIGIQASSPTGNVVITANIACVQVHTSTLSIGRDSNGAQDTSITQSSQTLWIDLPANISNVSNINLSGYLTANGNITGGNLSTGGRLTVTGNSNVGNLGTGGFITATGNVTGGNLTTGGIVSATGNVSGGNLTTGNRVVATGNVTGGNLTTGGIVSATGNVTTAARLISTVADGTAPIVVTSTTLVPNLNVARANVADFVNTNLVSTGTFYLILANATSGNVTESANANLSFNAANGALSATTFVGAFSGSAASATTAGTVTTNAQPNITSVGSLTSLDVTGNATANILISDVATGTAPLTVTSTTRVANLNVAYANVADFINTALVTTGTFYPVLANATSGNVAESANANLSFNAANGALSATTFVGNLSGAATTAGSATTAGTVTTAAQGNITSVGTLTSLAVTGNITAGNMFANAGNIQANYFIGDGGGLSNINISAGSVIQNGNSNVKIDTANSNVTISVTGVSNVVVVSNTGMNVAGTGNFSGNVNAGNVTATRFTGNFSGNVTTAAQANITSLGTLTGLTVNGTANLGSVSNVKITGSTGFLQSDGAGNLTFASVITQTIPGAANTLLLSSGSNSINTSGNIKFNDPQLAITGTLSVSGNANVGNIGATNITGTLTTNAQPNITSLGNLTGLTIGAGGLIINTNGNISVGAGNVTGNVFTANLFSGNGSSLSAIAGANVTGTVANATFATTASSTTNAAALLTTLTSTGTVFVPFISATANGNYAHLSNANFSANLANGALIATTFVGALSGAATSATTAGTVTTAAQGNITSVGTLTSLSVTGNGTFGNINTSGTVTATRFISNIATGTAPLTVTSTTRVSNLNVDYANVADNINVAAGTGNNFIIFANAATGNVAEITSTGLTANLSNNSITATTFVGALSGAATSATTAGTVTTAAQPNITSTGTLTSLSSSGNITGANLITTGYQIRSVGTGISAAGTVQANATALTKGMNIVSSVSSGTGVVLPTAVAGMVLTITNTSVNNLLVYPATAAAINSLAANAGFTQPSGSTLQYIAPTTTQWYTVGATYA